MPVTRNADTTAAEADDDEVTVDEEVLDEDDEDIAAGLDEMPAELELDAIALLEAGSLSPPPEQAAVSAAAITAQMPEDNRDTTAWMVMVMNLHWSLNVESMRVLITAWRSRDMRLRQSLR